MYNEPPKPIENHFELKKVCRNAGLWYVGSFMGEFIKRKAEWKDETKSRLSFRVCLRNMRELIRIFPGLPHVLMQ